MNINKLTIEYIQEADSCSQGLQFLEISTEDAGSGVYYVLKTERWALDDINDLIKLLTDFQQRLKDSTDISAVAPTDAKHLVHSAPSHEVVWSEIYKWTDEIRLPSGYDEDLDNLYKRLSVLWP